MAGTSSAEPKRLPACSAQEHIITNTSCENTCTASNVNPRRQPGMCKENLHNIYIYTYMYPQGAHAHQSAVEMKAAQTKANMYSTRAPNENRLANSQCRRFANESNTNENRIAKQHKEQHKEQSIHKVMSINRKCPCKALENRLKADAKTDDVHACLIMTAIQTTTNMPYDKTKSNAIDWTRKNPQASSRNPTIASASKNIGIQ